MSCLRAMGSATYATYLDAAIIAYYAEDKIASGGWPVDQAAAMSGKVFHDLLPQGLVTPDQHLFESLAPDQAAVVGCLSFAIQQQHGRRCAFAYDLIIDRTHRRQGHALRAFRALETVAAALGATAINLHVFGHNAAAPALYRKLGFAVSNLDMSKSLMQPDRAAGPSAANQMPE